MSDAAPVAAIHYPPEIPVSQRREELLEVIAANHMGAQVLGISCITNLAAGSGPELSHDDVTETTRRVGKTFIELLRRILMELAEEESRKSASVSWFDL